MFSKRRQIARGRIIAWQEQRFQLVTHEGRHLLLTLSSRFSPPPSQLPKIAMQSDLVEVEYEGDPALATGAAARVRSLNTGDTRRGP